jgi:glycosyltransferase involved in cell wall biosynthesis
VTGRATIAVDFGIHLAASGGISSTDRLRIALVSPPMLPVPPPTYAGTERVVAALAEELHRRGHRVTLFAPGDSQVSCELVPTLPRSLWSEDYRGDVSSFINVGLAKVWAEHERFDVIHSHVETLGFLFARFCPTPVLTTLHGRLDAWGIPELIGEFADIPLVAISESQRRWAEDANWVATIRHGLPLEAMPFSDKTGDYLAFVGRITPEKGITDCVELARRTKLPLKMAAKVYDEHEKEHFAEVVQPAIDEGIVEFLGELGQLERDPLFAGALATLMLGAWPEPFGLVAIESLATGTPVIARRAGALTETIEHGVDGFLVDDLIEAELAVGRVGELDRTEIRRRALERFSPGRMADEYETAYERVIAAGSPDRRRAMVGSR